MFDVIICCALVLYISLVNIYIYIYTHKSISNIYNKWHIKSSVRGVPIHYSVYI